MKKIGKSRWKIRLAWLLVFAMVSSASVSAFAAETGETLSQGELPQAAQADVGEQTENPVETPETEEETGEKDAPSGEEENQEEKETGQEKTGQDESEGQTGEKENGQDESESQTGEKETDQTENDRQESGSGNEINGQDQSPAEDDGSGTSQTEEDEEDRNQGVQSLLAGTGESEPGNSNPEGLCLRGNNLVYLGADGEPCHGWITGADGSIYYGASSGILVRGWQKINGKWYYFSRKTRAMDEHAAIGTDNFAVATEDGVECRFYFIRGAALARSWQTIDDRRYYFDVNGVMQIGKVKVGSRFYYFAEDGVMQTGFIKEDDATYYFTENGQMAVGWQTIDDNRYYFAEDGVMQTGMVKIGSKTCYFSEEEDTLGQLQTGLQSIRGANYYFSNSGSILMGWQKVEEEWRFFDPDTGKELTVKDDGEGWRTITLSDGSTERSYFVRDTTPAKGWQWINGKRYYFDANGWQWTQAKGWLTICSNRYYFNAEDNNAVYQGFLTLTDEAGTSQIYYLNSNGQMLKGWQTIQTQEGGKRYYFGTDGVMKTGAVELISGVYYLDEDGTAKNGFFTDDEGETRYCTSKGKMLTGWQTIDNEQYYFDADGVMAKGITAVGSKEYVFDPDDGQLVRDMVSIDGEMVYANSDGTLKHGPGLNGIDVSSWNGNINWTAVKNAGISFAIIRAGGRGTTQGSLYEDKYFKANIAGATAAGIKVGVYFYSQAITEAEAKQEAEMVLSLVSGYQVSYPIFIDVEASGGRADSLSRAARTNVINAFCSTIQARGYKAGVYANKNWMTNYINVSALRSNVTIWLAQYNSTITYQGNVDIWQYSSKGTVSGISGNVDMDLCYTRFR